MSSNIKSPAAHALARRLAVQTGESLTQAVTVALQERLDKLSQAEDPAVKVRALLLIGRRCAASLDRVPVDHATLLYDEHGVPA